MIGDILPQSVHGGSKVRLRAKRYGEIRHSLGAGGSKTRPTTVAKH